MRKVRKAFTLVEILIVVVILGILAAIVVPQFTSATEEARTGNLESQVKTIDSALELYRARTGSYPGGPTAVPDSAVFTTLNEEGYLKSIPRNPFLEGAAAEEVANGAAPADGAATATAGWYIQADTNGNWIVTAPTRDSFVGTPAVTGGS